MYSRVTLRRINKSYSTSNVDVRNNCIEIMSSYFAEEIGEPL
jgi:hypothetical protein